jgi:hypothetical protein
MENYDLEKRINKLQRQLKLAVVLWIVTFGVLTGAAWSWNSAAEQTFDKIRVRQITVVDENGTERIYLGSPLPDPLVDGKRAARAKPSTGIILNNNKGNEVSGWGVFDDGNQNLCFDYPDGVGEALCLLQSGERAGLIVKDKQGIILTMLGRIGFDEDAPKLFLSDFSGRTRVKLQAESENGTPKLELIDGNGRSIFMVSEPAVEQNK